MIKKILIVTPNFPPEDHVGVYRTYRLVKYLPRYGWKPYVLTIDVNYKHREDPSLLDSLPPEVEIHRARYIEPTTRGVRMLLGGKDDTAAAMQRRGEAPVPQESGATAAKDFTARRAAAGALRFVRSRWISNPDIYAPWYLPALRKARRLIREHDIPLVYSTQPDFTGHWVASTLQREGARWVADVRDPSGYLMRPTERFWDRGYDRRRKLEWHMAMHADAVSVASEGVGMILADMYGPQNIKRWEFIPTGIDEELYRTSHASTEPPFPYLLYPGRVYPQYGVAFLRIYAEALRSEALRGTGIKLLVVGDYRWNAPLIEPAARELGIADHVEVRDHMPQREIAQLLRGATAGVLMTGAVSFWWAIYAKAIEYMALRKPVIALVPELSVARMHLERSGLGVFLDGDSRAAAARLRTAILENFVALVPNELECDRYLASRQAESFARLFEEFVGSS